MADGRQRQQHHDHAGAWSRCRLYVRPAEWSVSIGDHPPARPGRLGAAQQRRPGRGLLDGAEPGPDLLLSQPGQPLLLLSPTQFVPTMVTAWVTQPEEV